MDWLTILTRCGCSTMVATNWAPVFAAEAGPERFSLRHEELDDFLGNILHESAMLTRTEESLSYSAGRMMEVWPSRFPTAASAVPFARNPQALANHVYGGRMGNTGPDDGWRYRGRGLIQVTGRTNYRLLAAVLGLPFEEQPDLLKQPAIALRSAVAWWERNVPDGVMREPVRVRRAVNGGTVGLPDVTRIAELARTALRQDTIR
jgi:putative chitinase